MVSGPRSILPISLFILFAFVLVSKAFEVREHYHREDKVINEDAFGYYLILPAYFKYQDPDFVFLDTVLKKQDAYKNYIPPVVNTIDNGSTVCKYFSGVALLQAPFYFIARVTDSNNGSGFEQHYHDWMLFASLFYCLLACLLIYSRLLKWHINPWLAIGLIFFVTLGTNLYAYITYDPAYSHVYSFFAIALLAECLIRYKENDKSKHLYLAMFSLGLVIVIRPLNGIVSLLIPFYLGRQFTDIILLQSARKSFASLLSFIVIPLVQSLIWHWQTGKYLLYPYAGESLDLKAPKIIDFLFSYNCGWAVYTPSIFLLLVLSILIAFHGKKIKAAAIAMSFFLLLIYLLSCWYYLHYGCTAGSRPITEFYGLITLFFAFQFKDSRLLKSIKFTILGILALSYFYNRLVMYQFYNNIINWCDMDRQRFEMIFLQTHEVYNYSTYPFWDFSRFDQIQAFTHVKVGKAIAKDCSLTVSLPAMDTNDSAILISIHGKANIDAKDYYLRCLLTDSGKYVEQQTLLLQRMIQADGKPHRVQFKFHIQQSLSHAEMRIGLERTRRGGQSIFQLDSIEFKRIKF